MRKRAILIVEEDRSIKVKEPLGNLADGGLVNVRNELFDYVFMLEDVLKYFSGVIANKHFEKVAPVATEDWI